MKIRPCVKYGPFRPQIPVGVPFWLAMILKKQGKCNVIPPGWLDVTTIKSILEKERGDDVFQVRHRYTPPHGKCASTDHAVNLRLCRGCRSTTSSLRQIYASMPGKTYRTGICHTTSWYFTRSPPAEFCPTKRVTPLYLQTSG